MERPSEKPTSRRKWQQKMGVCFWKEKRDHGGEAESVGIHLTRISSDSWVRVFFSWRVNWGGMGKDNIGIVGKMGNEGFTRRVTGKTLEQPQ